MMGSVSTPNFDSNCANLSFAVVIPALVNADSARRIQISMFALSNDGKSTFRGTRRSSEGCGTGAAAAEAAAAVCEILTVSRAAATDASVAALTVDSTKALMAAASMI